MERVNCFQKFKECAEEIKKVLSNHLSNFEIYVFGSVVRGDYSIGLSDIDVAIISDEFVNREKRLEVYDILFEKFFESPFEFHLLTEERWKFYLKFIDRFIKV